MRLNEKMEILNFEKTDKCNPKYFAMGTAV